jgi:chemotaxis receptor (MCP) glutamine deamidase CheD
MLTRDATRKNLQAKVCGLASVLSGNGRISRQNVAYAINFLEDNGVIVFGGSV